MERPFLFKKLKDHFSVNLYFFFFIIAWRFIFLTIKRHSRPFPRRRYNFALFSAFQNIIFNLPLLHRKDSCISNVTPFFSTNNYHFFVFSTGSVSVSFICFLQRDKFILLCPVLLKSFLFFFCYFNTFFSLLIFCIYRYFTYTCVPVCQYFYFFNFLLLLYI